MAVVVDDQDARPIGVALKRPSLRAGLCRGDGRDVLEHATRFLPDRLAE